MKAAVDQAEKSGAEVEVQYRPYMIDPNTQKAGEDYTAYNRRRWGGDGWTHSLRDRGKQMGLPFSNWKTWPNTFNAHRLCVWLEEKDSHNASLTSKQKKQRGVDLVNKFYELTYEQGANISTVDGAARAVEELGFGTRAEVEEWLKRGSGEREVAEADSYAKRDLDIHGVPFFVISKSNSDDRPVALNGAQGTGAFLNAFRQVGAGV